MSSSMANNGTIGSAPVARTSLKESILFAFDRDPSVSQQAAQMGIGQAQIDEARSGWMPQISLNGNTGHSQTTDSSGSLKNSAAWGLSLTQLVYDFGKTNSAISQSSAQHDSYRYQLMATLSSVAEKTALSYVDVKRYTDLTQAAQENILALKNVQQLAKLRSSAGLSSTSDELQTQTRVAGMQATLEQYNAALKSARARLSVLTGIDAQQLSPLPATLEVQQDSLDSIDYTLIPSVLAARTMESSAQYGIERAKSQHWPTLSLKGGRTRYESDNRSYWDDQIQLNIDAPLYQGGAVSARVRQAEGARAMAASQVDQARFDVLQKASVAMADWSGARGRMEAGNVQLENALRAREVYKNEYTLGKRSINDLLSVEQDVWQATSSKISAEYDSWASAVNYASAVDNLMQRIGIEKNAAAKLPDLS
ncbi:type I secretion system outer membrane protein [Lelliottia sp. F153]|uniref:TolC family outer membrane protein n=2 Tax=Enterobacteriaceae TaxID=543 RepID=A0ABD4K481_9ENTR|nr:TolC family outer membrane protein [Lelliottia nimipressuralis]PLY45592.1 type I secretion system outer membrane protein [Lelliottia sp. F159]PLY51754.1 type I secretion system outer membrane protein [Lelliottia sp. F154]PLY55116.1 type I secretion system outer membrane protein [Lelliottia sp. F153]UQC72518.1 type I secretion system outer membrane protein [Lelliottia sp. AC1]MBF4176566.1 TolC family outer membrane protein [Lelliottia nimipressuralis]